MSTGPTPQVPQTDLQLEIAHLLLIDIVGYSKLLVNEQVETVQHLNRLVRGTDCFRAAEASGKFFRVPTGDGMALLFFHSLEQPVRCALEIAQKLKEYPTIQLRMGIHSGPVNPVHDVNDALNVAGAGINIAQRVMDCGDAGHILLSKHVADDLAQYRHWQPHLRNLGEYEVKHGVRLALVNLCKDGLGNPALPEKLQQRRKWKQHAQTSVAPVTAPAWSKSILTVALILSAAALLIALLLYFRPGWLDRSDNGAASAVPLKSIAVLPFENLSEEKSNAYFAEGIQDEILSRLGKIADLKVISRTSTQQFKSVPENLREIARQLGVAHIVEGSVQKNGDAVRVNVQLIKADNDSHVWADTFDRKLTDIFSVESDIAKAIADQLQAKLTGREEQSITAKPTNNPEAYDAYLRGIAYNLRTQSTPANPMAAQRYFRDAVRLDPQFALAWALLSIVDAGSYIAGNLQPTLALREEARQAAETALNLQPDLGEAILAKGSYYYACLKDYDTAVRYFEQARELLPNSSRIPEWLAYVARRRGEWERSEFYFKQAERLDPSNVYLLTEQAYSYMALRRFPDALRKLDQVLGIMPEDADTLALQAVIAQAQGDLPRAAALLAPLRTAETYPAVEAQVYQTILERRPAEIIPRLKQILAKPDPTLGFYNGQMRFWMGWAQELQGDHTAAQETFRQARNELEPFLKEQPDNYILIGDLALTSMGLGDKSSALAFAERAISANPIEKDAMRGPVPIEILARVAARTGETDRAIAALEKLLSMPYAGPFASNVPLTPALLRADPMFDSLRSDPRFQKLAQPTGGR